METPTPTRYLGLDIGTKRVGVAVSDELGLLAQPVLTLHRKGTRDDLRSIARLARKYTCAAIVAGLPLHISGEDSPQAAISREFATAAGEIAQIPVIFWDERLTSREAHEILYKAGRDRQQHKQLVDQVAAVLILQSFLDHHRDAGAPPSSAFSAD